MLKDVSCQIFYAMILQLFLQIGICPINTNHIMKNLNVMVQFLYSIHAVPISFIGLCTVFVSTMNSLDTTATAVNNNGQEIKI